MRMRFVALLCAVLLAACGPAAVASGPPAATASTAPSVAPSTAPPTDSPPPSPSATTPPELRGKWGTRVSGESVVLTLDGNGYTIRRGGIVATGHMLVMGDEIVFDSSSLCSGVGRYRWAIEDDRLRFEPIGTDPCGRTEVLIGTVFGNRSPP